MRLISKRAVHTMAVFWIALGLAAASVPSEAGTTRQAVHGKFTAQIAGDDAMGRFRISHGVTDRDVVIDRLDVGAVKLDATEDGSGNLPSYHVFLITSDGVTTVDFGEMRLSKRGQAAFRLDTRRDTLPDGVTDLTDFDGGTIEVRTGDTVALSAAIPSFIGTGDENDGSGGAFRRDTAILRPTDASIRTRGSIFARYANARGGVSAQLAIHAEFMSGDLGDYSVVVIDGTGAETELCTLTAHGRRGADRVAFDTRMGDTLPGSGSVLDFSELNVELRDKDANVICTGTFPKVK